MILRSYIEFKKSILLEKSISGFFIERFLFFNLKKKNNYNFTNRFIFYNSNRNRYFHFLLQSFFKVKTGNLKSNKNLISRINLLKLRFEFSISDSAQILTFDKNRRMLNHKIYGSLNMLPVIPRKKEIISYKIIKNNFKKLFFNKQLKFSFFYWFWFFKKISENAMEPEEALYCSIQKIQNPNHLVPNKIIINKFISNSNHQSWINGIINILSNERKKNCKKITLLYIKACLMKLSQFSMFEYLSNDDALQKRKYSNVKLPISFSIDPIFNQSNQNKKSFFPNLFFGKIYGFKILASKKKLPLKLYTTFCLNLWSNYSHPFSATSIFCTKNSVSNYITRCNLNMKYNKIFDASFYQSNIDFKAFNENNLIFNELILKEAKDFHNELGAIFLLSQFEKILREFQINIWLNPLLFTSYFYNGGSIEVIPSSNSIHEIKYFFLEEYLNFRYHKKNSTIKKKSIERFTESLAGYSLLCYLLQIKDRHNANILLNKDVRLIHIDFSFILGSLPGNLKLEATSFKMSPDFLSILMGEKTQAFDQLKEVFTRGFLVLRKNVGKILTIAKSLVWDEKLNNRINYKLFELIQRFEIKSKNLNVIRFCHKLFKDSLEDWRTKQYDKYQLVANGIKM